MTENGRPPQDWVAAAHREYGVRLEAYALRIVRDAGRAAEIVQETFLKLCREQEHLIIGHLAPWLYTVCRRVALDVRRKESRMVAVADPPVVEPDQHQQSPTITSEQHEDLNRIMQALGQLSENQQECIRLKFQHGMSYDEIATITGLSRSNVGFQIHTGLKIIRSKVT